MTENPAGMSTEVLKILDICRDIEVTCSELYHYFEEIFSNTPNISLLWRKTALEEENHANQFVLALKLRRQGVVQSVNIDAGTAEEILTRIKRMNGEVRVKKPSIADALLLAIELEEDLSEYHLSTIALFEEESHKKLFEAMMKNDHDHVADLKRAYEDHVAGRE
jgi:rubrerythrin